MKTYWASHTIQQNLAAILRQFNYGSNGFIILVPVVAASIVVFDADHDDDAANVFLVHKQVLIYIREEESPPTIPLSIIVNFGNHEWLFEVSESWTAGSSNKSRALGEVIIVQ